MDNDPSICLVPSLDLGFRVYPPTRPEGWGSTWTLFISCDKDGSYLKIEFNIREDDGELEFDAPDIMSPGLIERYVEKWESHSDEREWLDDADWQAIETALKAYVEKLQAQDHT